MECRINAEDRIFQPAPGPVNQYRTPGGPGIRLDSHLYSGYVVPYQYDSLLAKIISTGAIANGQGKVMAQKIVQDLVDWKLIRRIIAMIFDTTSRNSGTHSQFYFSDYFALFFFNT